MKEGTRSPSILVELRLVPNLAGISFGPGGANIGAMTALADIERDPEVARLYPALSQAAASVATPQIRNVGTLGGNLCQRPRCWYYRSPLYDCLKKGGDTCFAVKGLNKYHAILGGDGCHIVHPSDMAVALIVLDADVEVSDGRDSRLIPVDDFFVGPAQNMLSEVALKDGEILTRVRIPVPVPESRSVYLKAKERQAYDFALVSVAASLAVENAVVTSARIALGGVAPVPFAASHVADAIEGLGVEQVNPEELGRLAVRDARPLSDNGYKVRLAGNLVARAVSTLLARPV